MGIAANLRRGLDLEIRKKVIPITENAVKEVVIEVYNEIISQWPVDTAWSLANNHISVTGREVRRLEPGTRPAESGVLLAKASAVHDAQRAKVRDVKDILKRVITLGNSVPYASDVGFDEGRGTRIYERAALIGEARARAKSDTYREAINRFAQFPA